MKLLTKISAGLLLTLGFVFLMVPVAVLTRKEATSQDKIDALGGFVLGLPAVAWGGGLARGLYRQRQQEASDRLHSTFYRLLQQGNGQITVMRFAMEAQLPATAAQQYLDEKAKEFDADFGVSEEGGIFYYFIL
jgi:large subunit ribosomal protein L7/L12